jgi:hypothetical protein
MAVLPGGSRNGLSNKLILTAVLLCDSEPLWLIVLFSAACQHYKTTRK